MNFKKIKVKALQVHFEVAVSAFFIASIIASKLFPSPIVLIFVIAISLFLIPLLVGKAVIRLFYKNHGCNYFTFISSNIIEWLAGFLIIYLSAAILFTFKVLNAEIFTLLIIILPLLYLTLAKLRYSESNLHTIKGAIKQTFGNNWVIPLIIIASILPLISLVAVQPFPLSMTQTGGRIRLSLEFINSGTMDLVHGYSAILSPVQSISAIVYNLHPFQILGATSYFSYIFFSFSIYLLSYKLTKDPVISLIPTFISPWFFLGGSGNLTTLENANMLFLIFPWVLYAGLDFVSPFPLGSRNFSKRSFTIALAIVFLSPVTYLLGRGGSVIAPTYFVFLSIFLPVILIATYYIVQRNNSRRIGCLFVFIIPFMLMEILHPYLGTLLVFFSVSFFIAASTHGCKTIKLLRIISVSLMVIPLLLVFFGINGINNFVFSSGIFGMNNLQGTASDLTVQQKWSTLLSFGPDVMVYLFVLLTIIVSIVGNKKYLPFAFASSIMLFITFLPDGNLWRSQGFINPLFSIIIAYCFMVVWNLVNNRALADYLHERLSRIELLKFPPIKIKFSTFTKFFAVFIVLLFILPIAARPKIEYYNNNDFKNAGEGYFSFFQTYDLSVSFWILKNYENEKILIISDPATMYYVGSLTAKDTLWTQYIDPFPTSIYPNYTWAYMDRLKDVFLALGGNESLYSLQSIAKTIYPNVADYHKIIVLVTPHTYYWLYENNTFPTRVKIADVDSTPIVNTLERNTFFSCVYQQANIVYAFQASVDRLNA
jgi:hypothetical protein